jgi:hypothetical protein
MAENVNPLVLPIKVDTSQVTTGVNALRNRLRELQTNTLTVSQNIAQTGNASTVAANGMAALSNQAASTSNSLNQLANSSVRARTTLTSLSLIAQDAPFGFIAIQNNLPALIQQFGLLRAEAGSNGAAFKQLGQSLLGPAGAFLAFSAVTAAVTYAIREYGSLKNAINALIGSNGKLYQELTKVNKEYDNYLKNSDGLDLSISKTSASQQGQITTIQLLTEQVGNLSLSESQRSNALKQLKEIDKDYYAGLTTAESDSEKLRKSTDLLTQSIINQAKAKGLADTISEITKQISALEFAQKKLAPEFTKLANQAEPEIKRLQNSLQQGLFGGFTVQGLLKISEFGTIKDALSKGDEQINNELSNLNATKEELKKILTEITQAFTPDESKKGKEFTLGLDAQDLDAAFNLDKIISSITKYGNALLDTNNSVEERKNALKELIAINPQVFSGLSLEKSATLANKNAIESYIRSLQILIKEREFDARSSKINTELRNAEIKKTEDAVKVSQDKVKAYEDQFDNIVKLTYAQDEYGNSTDKITTKSLSFLKVLKQQQDITAAINKALNNIYGPGTADENDPVKRVEELSKRIKQAKDNFENTIRKGLQQPFEDFFSTLIETGKFSLDSFEGLFKDMLKRIAAQIVSAGIAKLISSILFPPGATADALAGAAAGNSSGGGIIGALISLFGGRRSYNNVNFGGMEGGGMQMSGQVVFVQRGSDLVGVLNRTNSTINRVG